MPQAVPSKEEILVAFATDPQFPLGSVPYEASKDYIVLLPEVIGEERLGQLVDFRTLIQVEEAFISRILDEGFGEEWSDPEFVRTSFQIMLEGIRKASNDVAAFLAAHGTTEDDVFFLEEMDLGEKLIDGFKRRTLTFGDIVREQPSFFLA